MIIDINGFDTPEKTKAFIDKCEKNFEETVKKTAHFIAGADGCRAVTLAGPTCSGKTTAAALLVDALESLGKNAKIISIDDFYFSRDDMKKLGISDFEGISAIDTVLFRKTAQSLSMLKETLIPKYDFTFGKRVSLSPYTPSSNDIFIFEGIQAIYPEILSCLDSFKRISIYISVADLIDAGGCSFSPNEIRLMRRAVRDHYHRGTSVENTMILWDSVRTNEEKNIFPYVGSEDFTINSLIPYEIFLVGREFLALSECYSPEGENADMVFSLRQRLSKIMNEQFDHSLVPESSLLREFSE